MPKWAVEVKGQLLWISSLLPLCFEAVSLAPEAFIPSSNCPQDAHHSPFSASHLILGLQIHIAASGYFSMGVQGSNTGGQDFMASTLAH